jgi:hypothetical protein
VAAVVSDAIVVATVAAIVEPAEQTAVAAIAAVAAVAAVRYRDGAVATIVTVAAVTAASAEINRFGAAGDGQHKNNTVHDQEPPSKKGANPEHKYLQTSKAWSQQSQRKRTTMPCPRSVAGCLRRSVQSLSIVVVCDG